MLAFVTMAVLISAAPSSSAPSRPAKIPRVTATIENTGQTVAVAVGQQLVVMVPLLHYSDSYWYVAKNTGQELKLIAGPDTKRRSDSTPFKNSSQVFYFQRVAPGTVHLVLEQSYYSKPMILKVVDR